MERGDHLVSPRTGYSHHGLYLGRNKVIHYTGFSSGRHKGEIAITNLDEFCQGEGFSIQTYPFRLYTHEESAQRALSRLGEDWYDILLNNCEHFVSWCIQGLNSSPQVNNPLIMAVAAQALLKGSAVRTTTQHLLTTVTRGATQTTVRAVAGIATGAGLATTTGVSTAVAGLAATSAAPLAAVLATGAAVGYGIKKLADWVSGD